MASSSGSIGHAGRSLTGARIETTDSRRRTGSRRSLPHGSADRNQDGQGRAGRQPRRSLTGARIETGSTGPAPAVRSVAPSRERGSKRHIGRDQGAVRESLPHGSADRNSEMPYFAEAVWMSLPHGSADRNYLLTSVLHRPDGRSLTGARIETAVRSRSAVSAVVAPSRERGSKPPRHGRPLQGCGRRSLTGARIETGERLPQGVVLGSLPHGSADRNSPEMSFSKRYCVAPSRERGSKHNVMDAPALRAESLPHGSADRNDLGEHPLVAARGRSLTGARIETRNSPDRTDRASGRSLTGARIETRAPRRQRDGSAGRSLTGARIETRAHSLAPPTSQVAPSRERGSKLLRRERQLPGRRSLPHGSADRNARAPPTGPAPLAGC